MSTSDISHLFTFQSLDPTGSMVLGAPGTVLTIDRKNYRDLESSPLGLSMMACIITGPQQGGENGEESGSLELDSSENGLGNGTQIQL